MQQPELDARHEDTEGQELIHRKTVVNIDPNATEANATRRMRVAVPRHVLVFEPPAG